MVFSFHSLCAKKVFFALFSIYTLELTNLGVAMRSTKKITAIFRIRCNSSLKIDEVRIPSNAMFCLDYSTEMPPAQKKLTHPRVMALEINRFVMPKMYNASTHPILCCVWDVRIRTACCFLKTLFFNLANILTGENNWQRARLNEFFHKDGVRESYSIRIIFVFVYIKCCRTVCRSI